MLFATIPVVSSSTPPLNLTSAECTLLLAEMRDTFVDSAHAPTITDCDTHIVKLMWEQQINRVYAGGGSGHFTRVQELRELSDAQFVKLLVNAAAGSLMISSGNSVGGNAVRIRIRDGHFEQYTLHDTNRIAALQTMLVISILALASTWWREKMYIEDRNGAEAKKEKL